MEHDPFLRPVSHYRPEPIEIGAGEYFRADDQEVLFTNSILHGTVVLSYDRDTRIGFMGHFHDTTEEGHDLKNFLLSIRNASPNQAHLVLMAAEVEVVNPDEAPLIMLDCTDGTISIDNDPVDL